MHQSTTKTSKANTKTTRLRTLWSAAIVAALLLHTLLPATAFADGDFGWAVPLGPDTRTDGKGIAIDNSGNVLTTGEFFGNGDFSPGANEPTIDTSGDEDVYISRIGADGQWDSSTSLQLNVGGDGKDIGWSIASDTAGNIIVVGQFRGTADFDPGVSVNTLTAESQDDIFVLKLANDGSYQWARGYGGVGGAIGEQNLDFGYGTATDGADNVYVVGQFEQTVDFDPTNIGGPNSLTAGGSGDNSDGFLLKLDSDGAFQWVKQVNSPSPDRSIAVVTDDNFVYTGGYFQGTANFDISEPSIPTNGGRDAFVTKHNLDGTFQWVKRVGGSDSDVTYGLDVDSSGNVYMTGVFAGTANFDTSGSGFSVTSLGGRDAFVTKLDSNGVMQWTKQIGSTGNDEGFGIQVGTDDRVYVTGYFTGTATFDPSGAASTLTATGGSNNAFLAVFDASGNLQAARQLGKEANALGNGIALDSDNNPVITGKFTGNGDFDPDPVEEAVISSIPTSGAFVVKLLSDGANTPPVAEDDAYTVNQGAQNQALSVLDNDTDAQDGKPTLQSVDDSTLSGTAVISGSVISYSTPDSGFLGMDIFTYTVMDTEGLTDTATVTVTVEMTGTGNTPPVADTQPTVGMVKNESKTITLTGSDVDGDPLTFSIVTAPTNGALSDPVSTGSTSATVTYTPTVEYVGPDSFTFQVDDGMATDTATVNINVAAEAGTAPVANDVTTTVDEDSSVTITFDASDADAGDTLSYAVVTTPTNGILGSVISNTVVYTPAADYNGADSFTYMVMDTAGLTDTAAVNITVNPVNDEPTAPSEPKEVGVGENSTRSIELTGSDLDGDDLTFTIVSLPSNGTLSSITKTGTATATVDYTPNTGFVGTDSFTYEVSDGTATAQGTVNITVNDTNDAPVANDTTATTTVGTDVTITLSGTDADGDDLTFSIIALPESGELSNITMIDATSASVVYTPQEAGTFTFDFEVDDGNGGTNTGTVTVTVTEVSDGDVKVFLPVTPKESQ